jgi:hypothetical protein
MTTIDVIPVGGRHFLVQLRRMTTIPGHIGFDRYYEGTCAIELADGSTILQECFVYRPKNRRNVVGDRQTNWLALLVKTDLAQTQLSSAAIAVVRYGAELSEQEIAAIGLQLRTAIADGRVAGGH